MNTLARSPSRVRSRSTWAWAAVGGFGFLAVWARWVGLLPGDEAGLAFLKSYGFPGLRLFELIGSVPGIVALALVVAWICRRWLRPWSLIAVMAGAPVLEETLKVLVHRPRPTGESLGFPSGHAIASLTLTLLVCGSLWRVLSFRGKVVSVVVGVIFVVGIAVSRAVTGLHWPSDVVGGWLVALAYGLWTIPFIRQDAST